MLSHPGSSLWRIKEFIPQLKIIKADISDYDSLKKKLSKETPQKIFHLAGSLNKGSSFADVESVFKVNFQGTVNLLKALEGVKYDCFVNTGSSEEYGAGEVPINEEAMINPVSPYSASKAAAFLFCQMYGRNHGRPIITLRPFTVYGPGQGANMFIPQLIVSALQGKDFKMSEGKQTRDFIYVSDVAEGYLKAAANPKAAGQAINLGTGNECSLREMTGKIMALMQNPIKIKFGALPYRSGEVMRLYCDNAKAKKLLGWKPEVSIDEGLKETIKWYKENKKIYLANEV